MCSSSTTPPIMWQASACCHTQPYTTCIIVHAATRSNTYRIHSLSPRHHLPTHTINLAFHHLHFIQSWLISSSLHSAARRARAGACTTYAICMQHTAVSMDALCIHACRRVCMCAFHMPVCVASTTMSGGAWLGCYPRWRCMLHCRARRYHTAYNSLDLVGHIHSFYTHMLGRECCVVATSSYSITL